MENIRIRKVKITTDNKIHLAFEKKGGKTEDWDEYTMTCSELPPAGAIYSPGSYGQARSGNLRIAGGLHQEDRCSRGDSLTAKGG